MKVLFSLVVVIFAVFLAVSFTSKKKKEKSVKHEQNAVLTFKKRLLLTETEADFYAVLSPLVPAGFVLLPKVGLWAIVHNEQRAGWSKISQKQVDFVLFKNGRLPEPVLAIELDDNSHNRKSTKKRDTDKDSILQSAGIACFRVPVQKNYDVLFLQGELNKVLL